MVKETKKNKAITLLDLPDFKVEQSEVPDVRIKSVRLRNFKAFEDVKLDFTDGKDIKMFSCFFGPNGCGKTSILDIIQLLFSRFEGREQEELKVLLGRSVRHKDGRQNGIYGNDDFIITADVHSSIGDYQIRLNKGGFVKDHPPKIKELLYRLCFYARFDMELHQFQLVRSKWNIFKELFESITGFEIEEKEDAFNSDEANIMKQYVLGFLVHKPDETITHKECSAGERKIIKCFSTLLNKEYVPSIICIDNVEMHVETGRHINLIESMKKCFPNSQIFCTTHSYQISRNFGDRSQLYDLRLIKASSLVKKEQWRLYVSDEIKEAIAKLKCTASNNVTETEIKRGEKLIRRCSKDLNSPDVIEKSKVFLGSISQLYAEDLAKYYCVEKTRRRRHFFQ